MRGARIEDTTVSDDSTLHVAHADASRLDEQAKRHARTLERARVEASEAARASGNRRAATELLPSSDDRIAALQRARARKAMRGARDTPSASSTDPTATDARVC